MHKCRPLTWRWGYFSSFLLSVNWLVLVQSRNMKRAVRWRKKVIRSDLVHKGNCMWGSLSESKTYEMFFIKNFTRFVRNSVDENITYFQDIDCIVICVWYCSLSKSCSVSVRSCTSLSVHKFRHEEATTKNSTDACI